MATTNNAAHFQQMLDSLIRQAKYFLEESGTFYPFGSYVDTHQQIRPISFFSKDEYPESDEVLKQLEAAVLKSLKDGQYLTAIIGVDVSVNMSTNDSSPENVPALQLRTYDADGNISIRYCLYALTDNGYEFSVPVEL